MLTQNGYIAGAPTYLPVGELAVNRPLMGELPRPRTRSGSRRLRPGAGSGVRR